MQEAGMGRTGEGGSERAAGWRTPGGTAGSETRRHFSGARATEGFLQGSWAAGRVGLMLRNSPWEMETD